MRPTQSENFGDQHAQAARSQDCDHPARGEHHLLSYAQGCCEWFGEHGALVGHTIGNFHQVAERCREVIGERATPVQNSDHRAFVTMLRTVSQALGAIATTNVDGCSDPFPQPLVCWRALDHADEFMAQYPAETTLVSPGQLEVSAADAGTGDPDEYFGICRARFGQVAGILEHAIGQAKATHQSARCSRLNDRNLSTDQVLATRSLSTQPRVACNAPHCIRAS